MNQNTGSLDWLGVANKTLKGGMQLANKLMQRLNGQKPLEAVAEQYLKSQQTHRLRNTLFIALPAAAVTGTVAYLRRNRKQLPEQLLKTGRQQIQNARNGLKDMNPQGIMFKAFSPIREDLDSWLVQGERIFNQRIQDCQAQYATGLVSDRKTYPTPTA